MSGEWLKPNDVLIIEPEHFHDPEKVEIIQQETSFSYYGAISEFTFAPIRCVVLSVSDGGLFSAIWTFAENMHHQGQLRILDGAAIHAEVYRDQSNYDTMSGTKQKKNFIYYTKRPFILLWSAPQACSNLTATVDPHDLLRRPLDLTSIDLTCIFRGSISIDTLINHIPTDPDLGYACKLVQARMRLQRYLDRRKGSSASGQEYLHWSGAQELDRALFNLFMTRLKTLDVLPNMYDNTLSDPMLVELRSIFAIYRTDQEVVEELTSIYEALFDNYFNQQNSVLGHLSNFFNYNRDANRQVIYSLSLLDFLTALDQFCKKRPINPSALQYAYPNFVEELKKYQKIVLDPLVPLEDMVKWSYHAQTKLSLLQDMQTFNRKYETLLSGISWIRARLTDSSIATPQNFTTETRLELL